jgi:hypothetical protein
MFGLPPSMIENLLHNVFLSFMGGLVVHGYFTSAQLETLVSGACILVVFGLNTFTHATALAAPSFSLPPMPTLPGAGEEVVKKK